MVLSAAITMDKQIYRQLSRTFYLHEKIFPFLFKCHLDSAMIVN